MKTISSQPSLKNAKIHQSNSQFVPFVNERHMGKLILPNFESDNKTKISKVTFRNFKQVYNKQKIRENTMYSSITRKSNQQDLISWRDDWKFVKSTKSLNKIRAKSHLIPRECCSEKRENKFAKKQSFEKADEYVYKKINVCRPSETIENPQIKHLYENYIKVCSLNENIRREELTKIKKL